MRMAKAMSCWWDADKQRYRRSLPAKIFYQWGWLLLRRIMFLLPEETAHHLAIRGLRWVEAIDRIWSAMIAVLAFALIGALWLLSLLPGFTWNVSEDKP